MRSQVLQTNTVFVANPISLPSPGFIPPLTPPSLRVRGEPHGGQGSSEGSLTPPRNLKCTHCRLPRKGHPVSGCPNVTPPIPPKANPKSGRSPRRSPRCSHPLQQNFINQTNQANVEVNVYPNGNTPTSPRQSAAAEELDAGLQALHIDTSTPARSSRTIMRTRSEEDCVEHLQALEEMVSGKGAVCAVWVDEDQIPLQMQVTEKRGFRVRAIRPERSWSDSSKHVLVFSRDQVELDDLCKLFRCAARKGTQFKDIFQNLGMAIRLLKEIWTAYTVVTSRGQKPVPQGC